MEERKEEPFYKNKRPVLGKGWASKLKGKNGYCLKEKEPKLQKTRRSEGGGGTKNRRSSTEGSSRQFVWGLLELTREKL